MALRKAYRWQYIISGAQQSHFLKVLGDLSHGEPSEANPSRHCNADMRVGRT